LGFGVGVVEDVGAVEGEERLTESLGVDALEDRAERDDLVVGLVVIEINSAKE
jgi:hypothetical protein